MKKAEIIQSQKLFILLSAEKNKISWKADLGLVSKHKQKWQSC